MTNAGAASAALHGSMPKPAVVSKTSAFVSTSLRRAQKLCGHYCYPSNLSKCCACEDLRPIADGYECYVDGLGYISTAKRDDGYCPVCNTKNYDRWMARVSRETEKKRLEDAERERSETERALAAEKDRQNAVEKTTGRVTYSNGNVYVGDLLDGRPHGVGRMEYFSDSDDTAIYYEGTWAQGKHEGRGKKKYVDDNWYEGEWMDGMMHGRGVFHMNEVDILDGIFEEDEFCG
eukprot:CAMPEP_0194334358 /NCGR_PEP_ID=MMETSP0171-20130528/65855_1 /TAXON_ID=218684 /ORGANISM="Corethron pennatum, Strain L29A3" /LENGTH=232 /DNA_ID=CAMNT_0039096971 /DNA_START=70 /DNA_END=768 /DNA_ORIENTATION=+